MKQAETDRCLVKHALSIPRVEPIVMSAGELEHEWAGTPGRLIRDRYRRAAEMSRVRGKMSCLLINDIDAGIGHHENTQVNGRCEKTKKIKNLNDHEESLMLTMPPMRGSATKKHAEG